MISPEEFLRGRGIDPRIAAAESAASDVSNAEASDMSASGTHVSDTAVCDVDVSDATASDTRVSDVAVPDITVPGAAVSGAEEPSAQPHARNLRATASFGSSVTEELSESFSHQRRGRWSRSTGGNGHRLSSSYRARSGSSHERDGVAASDMPMGSAASGRDGMHGGAAYQGTGEYRATDARQDTDACQEAALRLLDSAARSVHDMTERLLGKGYDPAVVQRVIANLVRVGLLNDEAYAQGLVEHCLARQLGARGTERELLRKGVPRRIAHDAVQVADEQGRFSQAADELAKKTARRTRGLDRQTRLRRFWYAGGRKGHAPADIRAAADRYFSNDDHHDA